MDVRTFFEEAAPRALSASPELFRLDMSYRFRIGALPGVETWTLDLTDHPRCERNVAAPADCTLAIDRADFERMLDDPSCVRQLFHAGRVGVTGRMDAATQVPGLLRLLAGGEAPDGLTALLGGTSVEQFRQDYWPDRLFVSHAPLTRVREIDAIGGLASIDALLDVWPSQVRLADKHGGRLVAAEQARTLYRSGCHLAFGQVERVFPMLARWVEQIRWELDLPISAYGRCHLYASPDGSGEGAHFDENVNFVLQLRGEKEWRVAPNRHLRWPTARHTSASPHVADELRLYASGPLPTTLPADAESIRLRPGSLLMMPRGYWHETSATGHSLSLNFTYDQPTWADVLLPEIYRRLLRLEPWRELATGAGSPHPEAAASARQRLTALIDGIARDLSGLDAGSAIARLTPTESADTRADSR